MRIVELPSGHPEQRKGLLKTRKLIEELVRHVMDYCHFDARHIFFFGFSQGGTVALDQLLEGEIRNFGGAISVSGYPMALSDISNKERIPYDGPILITQGEKDPVIGPKQQAEKMVNYRKAVGQVNNRFNLSLLSCVVRSSQKRLLTECTC